MCDKLALSFAINGIRFAELELIGFVSDDIGQYPVLDGHLLPGLARQDDLFIPQLKGALLVPFGTFDLASSDIPESALLFFESCLQDRNVFLIVFWTSSKSIISY